MGFFLGINLCCVASKRKSPGQREGVKVCESEQVGMFFFAGADEESDEGILSLPLYIERWLCTESERVVAEANWGEISRASHCLSESCSCADSVSLYLWLNWSCES